MEQKETILQEANRIINGPRKDDYGSATESFSAISIGWSSITNVNITADQVALMMIWLKICRANNNASKGERIHRDSIVDICGYAALIEVMDKELYNEGETNKVI